jgi:hypothetical protein
VVLPDLLDSAVWFVVKVTDWAGNRVRRGGYAASPRFCQRVSIALLTFEKTDAEVLQLVILCIPSAPRLILQTPPFVDSVDSVQDTQSLCHAVQERALRLSTAQVPLFHGQSMSHGVMCVHQPHELKSRDQIFSKSRCNQPWI